MNQPTEQKPGREVDCDFDPKSITADAALERILSQVEPVRQVETIALRDTMGRITARDIRSRVKVPNHTNSAMDGYALSGRALPDSEPATFDVIGASFAGSPFRGEVADAQCVRIMTGAVMPAGCDTVIPQERVERQQDRIVVKPGEKPGSNVRQTGEDLEPGDTAIAAGTRIGPAHLGLAVSLGFSELPVWRRPRVAFFFHRRRAALGG